MPMKGFNMLVSFFYTIGFGVYLIDAEKLNITCNIRPLSN